ncbi:ISL3 family transposase [Pseudonocardia sichuanensis]|uniref:ISL3 family transposase n=1 Tax=Pseudonocardia kunmingensis TaxID=630975 RepID=UPI0011523E12|nr:ISL3 family transposase [Pseudonocardia kunmingensis]
MWARPRAQQASCPRCQARSGRVHCRYERRLADAAIAGRPVEIELRVRRFVCENAECAARTFAEQVPGLTTRHARRSPLLRRMLESIGLALAGRAGARLAETLGLPVSRSTVLRLIRALPDPESATVRVLGVDDFALRRGHVYGTVLVDIDTRRPIDLLADREAATFAGWLDEHPGAEVICRDRAGAYAEGASTGAPSAIQVADRWHLWHNLAERVEKTVAAHHGCLRAHDIRPEIPAAPGGPADLAEAPEARRREGSALVTRTRQRYEAVQALKAQGAGIKTIMRELRLAKETVRRFYRAANVEELLAKPRSGRPSLLDRYKPYLLERWNAGVTNASALYREISEQGYHGSQGGVAAYLAPFRELAAAPPAEAVVPKVRQVVSWMLRNPADLDDEQQLQLKQARASCPHLDAAAAHVAEFAQILTGRHGERLDAWMVGVNADDLPHLHRFVAGLRRDHDAVLNGLTLPYSSGSVEGNVNRIKMIKRQMYGRANFDLLRKRVLLAT